jgi:subtilase family serine protease
MRSLLTTRARWVAMVVTLSVMAALAAGAWGLRSGVGPVAARPAVNAAPTEDTGDSGLGPLSYTPRQMREAYGVEALFRQGYTGKGQTVVVVDSFGSPTLRSDAAEFSRRFNLAPVNLDVQAPLGARQFDPGDMNMLIWAEETTLDVEMVHAMAPDAAIVVLTSPVAETEGTTGLPEFRTLEQYAVDNHLGSIVSQSWDASETSLSDAAGRAEVARWNSFYQTATTEQGVTFVASSGDFGATDYPSEADYFAGRLSTTPTTGFPTSSPWVVAVGGTSLTLTGARTDEVVWSDGTTASGGGFSRFYTEPDYQKRLPGGVQREMQNRRGVPDVAASADPGRGPAFYFRGEWRVAGGTSASAPLWAGILAVGNQMAGHPLGFVNPALYAIGTSSAAAQDFRDITVGNNGNAQAGVRGYDATSGWDAASGFGAPIASKLLPDLIAASAGSP